MGTSQFHVNNSHRKFAPRQSIVGRLGVVLDIEVFERFAIKFEIIPPQSLQDILALFARTEW